MIQGAPGNDYPTNLAGPKASKAKGYWGWELKALPDRTVIQDGVAITITETAFTGKRKWYSGDKHPSQLRERKL